MKDFLNDAREALDKVRETAAPVVEDVKEKVEATVADLKEKAAPVIEDMKEKVDEVKAKATPVVEKVKDGVNDAVEAMKEGAEKIGDIFTPDAPGVNVKNELFDEFGQQVEAQKAAAQNKAEEMQKKLQELMKGNK